MANDVVPRAERQIVAISVDFAILTSKKLRKIVFGLRKGTEEDNVTWTITFQIFDRKKDTDPWGEATIDLKVSVTKKLISAAEVTADRGLDRPQRAYAIGPASDAAERFEAGEISERRKNSAIRGVLRARGDDA